MRTPRLTSLVLVPALLAGCAALLPGSADAGPQHGQPAADGGGDVAAARKQFSVKDVQIGMKLADLAGFKPHQAAIDRAKILAASDAFEKILDEKECADRPDCGLNSGEETNTNLGEWREGVDFLRVYPTKTDSKRIWKVEYRFHNSDVFARTSKLGAALIARYGEPYKFERGTGEWHSSFYVPPDGGLMVEIECESKNCDLRAEDAALRYTEEKKQEQLDQDKQRKSAPPPPKF